MSQSRKRKTKRPNRGAQIITITFSVLLVLSVVLGLIGPLASGGSDDPTPIPTRVYPTAAPLPTLTSTADVTATPDVPTPVMVTPTTSP